MGLKKVTRDYSPPIFVVEKNDQINVFYGGFVNDSNSISVARCKAKITPDGKITISIIPNEYWVIDKYPYRVDFSKTTDPSILLKEFLASTKILQFVKTHLKNYEIIDYIPHELCQGFQAVNCCNIFSLFNWNTISKDIQLEIAKHFFNNYLFTESKNSNGAIIFNKKSYSSLNSFIIN